MAEDAADKLVALVARTAVAKGIDAAAMGVPIEPQPPMLEGKQGTFPTKETNVSTTLYQLGQNGVVALRFMT